MATIVAGEDDLAVAQREFEKRVRSFAKRYGFRSKDFFLTWDGGALDPTLTSHALVIATADGRHAEVRISREDLLAKPAWKGVRDLDDALSMLQRRVNSRGE